jgi:hypothetical protein
MDQDMLIGFAVIAGVLAVILLLARRARRHGRRSYGHGGESAFVFGVDGDGDSSCDSGGDGGDCGGGGD